ncbi:hypothetical protein C8R48DRAFT_764799 [Suillus tomentosus]|nr:hypothetical protein C8R48DRAFT_764799 [Suillus tomentosus]
MKAILVVTGGPTSYSVSCCLTFSAYSLHDLGILTSWYPYVRVSFYQIKHRASSCDALIIHSAGDPVHVPLDIKQADVSEFSSEFQSLAQQFGSSNYQLTLVGILRKLWNDVVDPIIQALKESEIRPGSRIWWCPTADFTLLPLHAAGPYEKGKDNASSQHFVAIGQGNPAEGKELKCVAPELAVVARHVTPVISFTSLEDGNATVEGALDALDHNQWLHLACHGMPNRTQPFESSFAMRDGPLMIKDIIRSDWQNPQFAFLSACHTTVGDKRPRMSRSILLRPCSSADFAV